MSYFKRWIQILSVASFIFCADGMAHAEDVLIVASHIDLVPFEYFSEEGLISGIDIDIAKMIGQEKELSVQFIDMETDELLDAVNSGRADIAISAITVTEEKQEIVAFSDDYLHTSQRIIVTTDSPIETKKDLEGMTLAAFEESVNDYVKEKDLNLSISSFTKDSDILSILISKEADAVIVDEETAKILTDQYDELRMLDDSFKDDFYAIAVRKEDEELLTEINQIIATLKETGELEMIKGKYIKSEEVEEETE